MFHFWFVVAVHIPGEVVLDPWLFSIALAAQARENGAHIVTNFSFDPETSFFHDGIWTVYQKKEDLHKNGPFRAKAIVNAAGLWAESVQAKIQGTSPWTAKPRRGQYRLYKSSETTRITHPVQPIPTQRTKGIMVFSTLYDTIVVGPTGKFFLIRWLEEAKFSCNVLVCHSTDRVGRQVAPL
jgi:glycerol-3-phosphate dehydrogenase